MLKSIVEQRENVVFIARRKKFPKYHVSEKVLLLKPSTTRQTLMQYTKTTEKSKRKRLGQIVQGNMMVDNMRYVDKIILRRPVVPVAFVSFSRPHTIFFRQPTFSNIEALQARTVLLAFAVSVVSQL
jgi:hypothetical protein